MTTRTNQGMILDLFAGPRPGGWSEGLRMLGLSDIGIEWDAAACKTRAAAGHLTIRADVSSYPVRPFMAGKVEGLIASPPCQDFSLAGKQAGRSGEKGQLIDTVPVWVAATWPRWIACEQVPPALPIWREHAETYRQLGYSVWTGILNAADYGVPQTRKRAFLLASLDGSPLPPNPTHSKNPQAGLFGVLEPWVTMAEALGWSADLQAGGSCRNATERTSGEPAPTLAFGNDWGSWSWKRSRGVGIAQRHGDRPPTPSSAPAPTITGRARSDSWELNRRQTNADGSPVPTVPASRPAPTVTGIAGSKSQWVWQRPATTVMGDPRIAQPGHTGNPGKERSMTGAVRISIEEAAALQSFRPDYPWSGSRSKQLEQIGNAVCPLLAAHVIGALTGTALEVAA